MNTPFRILGFTASAAFLLAPLVGQSAARADKPLPDPMILPTPRAVPYPRAVVVDGHYVRVGTKEGTAHKLQLCIPYTPTNDDGSRGKRVLVTIQIEAEDREHALEAAEQMIDQLLVQPRLDDLIAEHMEQLDKPCSKPVSPAPAPMTPSAPAKEDAHGADEATPAADKDDKATEAEPLDVPGQVAGALMILDWACPLLGLNVNLRPLAVPYEIATYDPEHGPQQMRFEAGALKRLRLRLGHLWVDCNADAAVPVAQAGEDAPKGEEAAGHSSQEARPKGTLQLGWAIDSLPISQEWLRSWLGQPAVNSSSDAANKRVEQLLNQSDDSRRIQDEWRTFWLSDQPSGMTYERIHGGIGP
jgi:hypothetical protein